MECRILDYNYAFQNNVAITASSSNTEFPVSNIQSTIRSKIWRSAGNFVIDATNNKIDFKNTGAGALITATVTPGTYTAATLPAAIQGAMAAVDGANTYTVTYAATKGFWSFATSGAFLSLLWASGTNASASLGPSIGFSADSTGATSYTSPSIAIHTEEWILLDTMTINAIDSFALFFDAMRAIPFSSNAQIWIQANATNTWASPAINQAVTIDTANVVATYFWATPQSYRYWRLRIKDPANANLYVEVSKIVLSGATQISRVPQNGFNYMVDDQSVIEKTAYGHEYADLYPVKKVMQFVYGGLTYSDIQALDAIYKRVGRSIPIVVAMDARGQTFNSNQFLIYGKFKEAFNPTHHIATYFDFQSISFEETF